MPIMQSENKQGNVNPLMGREIKFRAWLIKEKKMVDVDTICQNKGYGGALEIIIDNPLFDPTKKKWEGENRPCDSYLNHSMQVHKDRAGGDEFILMQFTGLFDKNNNPIYEGDVLRKWYSRDISGKDIVVWNEEVKFETTHEFGGFEITFLDKSEIVGNIYSNPELLNQK